MESVDTRDLKSLARMSMRVRVPPVLPLTNQIDYYDESIQWYPVDKESEVYVYNSRGRLVSLGGRTNDHHTI